MRGYLTMAESLEGFAGLLEPSVQRVLQRVCACEHLYCFLSPSVYSQPVTYYEHPESGLVLTGTTLKAAEAAVQRSAMEWWFRAHFEDPAVRTPYESAEGGYMWIWGGPYDAKEELENEFGGVVPFDVIEQLSRDLQAENWQWAPRASDDDYDELVIGDIAEITDFYDAFCGAVLDIETLLETPVKDAIAHRFYRLLYVNAITALETYLSDAFINTVVNRPSLMRRFIETCPEFQTEKVPLSSVFQAVAEVEKKARTHLTDVVWHRLDRVKNMYRDTLKVEFPADFRKLFQPILIRHDIVHRNGRTKEGLEIEVDAAAVNQLLTEVQAFVIQLDIEMKKAVKDFAKNP